MGKIYVGDTPSIIADCGEDVTGATTLEIKWKKPGGGTAVKTATAYQTNFAKYDVQAGELDEDGIWTFQVYAEGLGTWSGHGEVFTEKIYPVEAE